MAKPTRGSSVKKSSTPTFYFLVEGETEADYIAKLKAVFKKSGKVDNNKGGGAKSILEAAKKIDCSNFDYSGLVVWFDKDHTYKDNAAACEKIIQELLKKSTEGLPIYIAFSNPVTEHWLLIHFDIKFKKGCDNSNDDYLKFLQQKMPTYKKGNIEELTEAQICCAWKELYKFIEKVNDERDNDEISQCFPLDFASQRASSYLAINNYFCLG